MTTKIVSDKWKMFEPTLEDDSTSSYEYKRIYSPNHGFPAINNVNIMKFEARDMDAFILPNKAYLQIEAEITDKATGVAYTFDNYNVAVQNAGSLFERCELFVNDKSIELVDNSYRVTHLRNTLDYSDDTIRSISSDQLVFNDTGNGGTDKAPFIFTANNVNAGAITITTANTVAGTTPHATTGVYPGDIPITEFTARDSVTYNRGFHQRHSLTRSGKFVYRIPLSRIFGFCYDYRSVLHGTTFRIELRRNIPKEVVQVTGTDVETNHEPIVTISEAVLYMPYVKPSLQVLAQLEDTLTKGGQTSIGFDYWTTYGPYNLPNATNINRTISALSERPSRVIVGFKTTDNYKKAGVNSLIYEALNVTRLQLKAGSGSYYPEQPFEIDMTAGTGSHIRMWEEFLRTSNKQHNLDGGSTVSYQSFKNLYPFYCFDLRESWRNVVFGSGNTVDITIECTLGTAPGGTIEMFVWVASERELLLDIVSRATLLSIK